MQSELFNNFVDSISTLTLEQYEILSKAMTNAQIGANETEESSNYGTAEKEYSVKAQDSSSGLALCIESLFSEHPVCPKCQGHDIGRWGFQSNRQRYHCKTCNTTFNAFSGTPCVSIVVASSDLPSKDRGRSVSIQ